MNISAPTEVHAWPSREEGHSPLEYSFIQVLLAGGGGGGRIGRDGGKEEGWEGEREGRGKEVIEGQGEGEGKGGKRRRKGGGKKRGER